MTFTVKADENGRPSIAEIRAAVENCPDGISAEDLVTIFTDQDHPVSSVRRALQRALDGGQIQLGSKLRLYGSRQREAA